MEGSKRLFSDRELWALIVPLTGNLAAVQMIPGSAVQLAVATILARCAEAGDYDQARYYNRKLLIFTHGSVAVVSGCLWLALPVVLSLYQLSGGTAELAREMFLWHTVGAVVLWPSAFILAASLRAAGDVHFTMGMSVLSMWVFRFGGLASGCEAWHGSSGGPGLHGGSGLAVPAGMLLDSVTGRKMGGQEGDLKLCFTGIVNHLI